MEILFIDEHIVVVNKPAGMLVHRTKIAADVSEGFALQTVRDQLEQKVFPVHRIDRPTSGTLMFGLSSEAANKLKSLFDERTIQKEYRCIVRGFSENDGTLDYPLTKENGNIQMATTNFELIQHFELPIVNDRFSRTRYSELMVEPKTGRMHQIRRHFAKKRQYLLGDTKYGDLKTNRAFRDYCQIEGLMLHARSLTFKHPLTNQDISVVAQLPDRFKQLHQVIAQT